MVNLLGSGTARSVRLGERRPRPTRIGVPAGNLLGGHRRGGPFICGYQRIDKRAVVASLTIRLSSLCHGRTELRLPLRHEASETGSLVAVTKPVTSPVAGKSGALPARIPQSSLSGEHLGGGMSGPGLQPLHLGAQPGSLGKIGTCLLNLREGGSRAAGSRPAPVTGPLGLPQSAFGIVEVGSELLDAPVPLDAHARGPEGRDVETGEPAIQLGDPQ